ncbi:MAG TPA: heme lyase CcmF/NrfE family subunit [Ramlibacter sp.]|uniref:heme lyase CcmF/NrfE family subunit n=1 Tax=Ramlibacter sp. TaxID=1917967 RepID=UPI002BF29BE6|nr:heme lyase CcmF/NrfE family subunit [Ramlibacter sp.]HVZ43691.1 heme lyase CcmF/NrfE family subunit [Ramlibacter sp.]
MIPELGHYLLMLALAVSLALGVIALAGAQKNRAAWIGFAVPAARTLWFTVASAFACLAWSFYANDFSVLYVAEHSNSKLPVAYRLAAVWGGHEGSLLLWVLMLTSWMLAVSLFSRQLSRATVARVLGVMSLVGTGFLLFMLTTSSPFLRLVPAAADGQDLNPLLQDPGLVIHPPMLYMGYVGFSVPFAFAIAALLVNRLDAAWARWSRPWTLAAWIFLTLGIALGSGWAYYELGWGGWWFWDPVENASFLPWLIGTALLHSLAVTEKRGLFRQWTVVLAIIAFSLSLLGTFLVRSGVLTSVHAFAADPKRGVFILIFLAAVVGSSFTLYAMRAGAARALGSFEPGSRETLLLANNLLLATAAATVLLGTLYPLIVDALGMGKLSVGAPYFNAVFVPLMIPVLLLMAAGPRMKWKSDRVMNVLKPMRIEAAVAVIAGALLPFALGTWSPLAALGLAAALWIILTSLTHIRRQLKAAGRLSATTGTFWGMHVAHIGIACAVIGITLVKGYEQEKDVRMAIGDTVTVGGYQFRMTGLKREPGPNYVAEVGEFEITRGGAVVATLKPEKRKYLSSSMPMTEAAIDAGVTRDLYVSLGEPLDAGMTAWAVRVYYKPFVDWIWGGALLMAIGGIAAALDRRYRKTRPGTVPAAAVGARA